MTVPAAAARFGAPYAHPMSMPSCIRPQRMPKPLVTTPSHGQMSPAADGCPVPVEPAPSCAALICAASDRALGRERLDLAEELLARLARARERALLQRLDGRQAVAIVREPVAGGARLVGARRDHGHRRGLQPSRPDGRTALRCRARPRSLDLPRDALILRAHALEELDVVDEIVEARRGHEEREQVRRLVDVRGSARGLRGSSTALSVLGLEPYGDASSAWRGAPSAASRRACSDESSVSSARHARLRGVDRGLGVLELCDDGGELGGQYAFL